jgi:hypothetical protein
MFRKLKSTIWSALDRPAGQTIKQAIVKQRGKFREMEEHGLLIRAPYAYGILRAADLARLWERIGQRCANLASRPVGAS